MKKINLLLLVVGILASASPSFGVEGLVEAYKEVVEDVKEVGEEWSEPMAAGPNLSEAEMRKVLVEKALEKKALEKKLLEKKALEK